VSDGVVRLDGSYGEGGGQILRTALALSALTGRPLGITNIRAGRSEPGLAAQHLAAVRAMAAICQARVAGDALGSRTLAFEPSQGAAPGEYVFDVGAVASGGSAGSVALILQALLLPLALSGGTSRLKLVGGTHVRWSPAYHYLAAVYLPLMEQIGLRATLELGDWGWFPRGGGQLYAQIEGVEHLRGVNVQDRGPLRGVWGLSAVSNLPDHIAIRQRDRALARLRARHIRGEIDTIAAPSPGPGTMLFVVAQYEHVAAGFTGYGRLRYPAERVADDALDEFEQHLTSKMALDPFLADQALLPLALAEGPSAYTTSRITRHLTTASWVISQFLERDIRVEGQEGEPGTVRIP